MVYGFAAVSVAPFAFNGRWIDLPIAFVMGCILGLMQLIIAPSSELYANVFEISASLLMAFLGRMFGYVIINRDDVSRLHRSIHITWYQSQVLTLRRQ